MMLILLFINLFTILISSQCVPFTLNNTECSFLNRTTYYNIFNIPESILFDYISLQISDVRMIQPLECRRALIWYICSQAFPICGDIGPCSTDYDSCMQINDACNGVFSLNCSSDNCNIKYELENPIPVLTCLQSNNVTIPCCPTPFEMDSEGECILACNYNLPYFFPPNYDMVQHVCQIIFYIIVWIGLLFMIFVYAPLVISFWKPFPQYLLPSALLFEYLYLQTLIWELYDDDYLCGNEDQLIKGSLDFLASYRCVFQAGFSFLFLFLGDCYTLLLSISIFLRTMSMSNKKYELWNKYLIDYNHIVQAIIWAISISIFISVLVIGLTMPVTSIEDPLVVQFSYGGYLHCYPSVDRNGFVFYFTYLIRTIVIGTSMLLLVLALILFTNMKQLFILQWRLLIFIFHNLIIQCIFEILTYYLNPIWLTKIITTATEYPQCVATHPRDPAPICPTDPISNGWYLHFYFLLRSTSIIIFCTYVYATNYYYRLWWWILITERRIFTQSDITSSQVRITNDTSNNSKPNKENV